MQLAKGIDPGAVRKAQKQANTEATETFEIIAREWHERFKSNWTTEYASKIMSRLEGDVFPYIGARPINEIKAPELLTVLRRVEARGTFELAHRIRIICGQVFRYAVATGRAERDPAADLRGALSPVKTINRAAITEPKKVGALLRAIDDYKGSFVVKCALRPAPLFFVRPGELRHAEWKEVSFENAEWNIPASMSSAATAYLPAMIRLWRIWRGTSFGRHSLRNGCSTWIRRGLSSIRPWTERQTRSSPQWNGWRLCARTSRIGASRW
jgi:integrase